jgi:hypothetical protein
VDFFCRCQAAWFGNGSDLRTILLKSAVDMFLFSPVLICPVSTVFYRWRDAGFRSSAFEGVFRFEFVRSNIIPVIVVSWMVFIPVCLVVYSVPLALQVPFAFSAQIFWILLLITITEIQAKRDRGHSLESIDSVRFGIQPNH